MSPTPTDFPNKTIFYMTLRRCWFEKIFYGDKREEYREIKKYWERVFVYNKEDAAWKIKIGGKMYKPEDVVICFSLGYRNDRQQGWIECLGLRVDKGKHEWGAVYGRKYFVLELGKIY